MAATSHRGMFIALLFVLLSPGVAHAESFCTKLRRFENAALGADGTAVRWVELHWVGVWLDFERGFGVACTHSPDAEAAEFCAWLVDNTNIEFPSYRMLDTLRCGGRRFGAHHHWNRLQAEVERYGRDSRLVLYEFVYGVDEESRMRVAVYPSSLEHLRRPLPPLAQLRPDAEAVYRGY